MSRNEQDDISAAAIVINDKYILFILYCLEVDIDTDIEYSLDRIVQTVAGHFHVPCLELRQCENVISAEVYSKLF